MSTVIETADADAPASSAFFTVACPGMGCHQNCPVQAEVRGGRRVGLTAAPVPGAPEDTHACLRGLAAVELPDMPQRLKYPMRRLGKRGKGHFGSAFPGMRRTATSHRASKQFAIATVRGTSFMNVKTLGSAHCDTPSGTHPNVQMRWEPTRCMHCRDAPCLTVCAPHALYRRPDGIVVLNEDE